LLNGCYWLIADIDGADWNVRYRGNSGHYGLESGHEITDVRFSADYVRYWG